MSAARPTVKAGVEMIRASRKLVLKGTDPFRWSIRNTAGDGTHELEYDSNRENVVCLTCEANYRSNRCWARARVLADLEQRFGNPKPQRAPEAAPEPPPESAIGSMSWRDVFKQATGERKL